jgi:hypothetical protein
VLSFACKKYGMQFETWVVLSSYRISIRNPSPHNTDHEQTAIFRQILLFLSLYETSPFVYLMKRIYLFKVRHIQQTLNYFAGDHIRLWLRDIIKTNPKTRCRKLNNCKF